MERNAKITVLGLMGNSAFLRVSHFHSVGETLKASSLYMEPGGKGCNQAVAAVRQGAQVSFLSCMGADSTAQDCLAFMHSEGIACYTEFKEGTPSPYACILTDSQGENQVTVYGGSAQCMTPDFVGEHAGIITGSDILLLNNECPLAANQAALDIALAHGVMAVLNPAPFLPLPRTYLRSFSLITPNRHEAAMLCGLPADSSADVLLHGLVVLGVQRAVITLGGEGAIAWDGERTIRCPAQSAAAQDTTGAGDCFNGVLCCGLAEGLPMEAALRRAAKAAAFSVSRKYVMPSLPHLHELEG